MITADDPVQGDNIRRLDLRGQGDKIAMMIACPVAVAQTFGFFPGNFQVGSGGIYMGSVAGACF